jgi:flagellar basal-body rod modification protein FlgD
MTTAAVAHAAANQGANQPEAPSNPAGMLGQNDFLKLMIAQLQAQDPLNPGNTNEYVSELAQFTEVEQTTNLANANELSSAVQMIGHTVDYSSSSGGSGSGKVTSVQSSSSGVTVTIEGVSGVALSAITEVK